MTIGMDTSVVLRLLIGEPADQAKVALKWLRKTIAAGITPVVSDLVATDVYFALQHHFGVSKAEALRHIEMLMTGGEVSPDGVLAKVLAMPELSSAKPGFVDRLIYEQYLHGSATGMVTFEKAARTLPKVKLLD